VSELRAYAFFMRRPIDSQAWPTIYLDRERAEDCPDRVSAVVEIVVEEFERGVLIHCPNCKRLTDTRHLWRCEHCGAVTGAP